MSIPRIKRAKRAQHHERLRYAITMMMHFPKISVEAESLGSFDEVEQYLHRRLCCSECEDFKHGFCTGENLMGPEVALCMMEKSKSIEFF